jgi:hypothetical protein
MTDSGDQITWNTGGTHTDWIDLSHGRIFKEDAIVTATPGYIPLIEVSTDGGSNWDPKVENSWGNSDNDYDIDYSAGTITFNSALGGSDQVRATFYKAGAYSSIVKPDAGKRLKLTYVEVQFTKDIDMNQKINFEIWVYNPADLPNKIPIMVESYKRIVDFYQESTGPFPVIPAHGGATRGIASDLITIPFNYLAYRDIKDSQGTELRISLDDGTGSIEFGGTHANVTFYCLTEDE